VKVVYARLNLPPGNSQRQKLRNGIAEDACAVIGRLACCAKSCIGNRKKRSGEHCKLPSGVWSKAPAKKRFGAYFSQKEQLWWQQFCGFL